MNHAAFRASEEPRGSHQGRPKGVTPTHRAGTDTQGVSSGTTGEARDQWSPRHPRVEVSGGGRRGWGGGFSQVFQVEKAGDGVCAVSPRVGGALVGALWLVWLRGLGLARWT